MNIKCQDTLVPEALCEAKETRGEKEEPLGRKSLLGNKHYCKLIIGIQSQTGLTYFYKRPITCEIQILNLIKCGSGICNRMIDVPLVSFASQRASGTRVVSRKYLSPVVTNQNQLPRSGQHSPGRQAMPRIFRL